MVSVYFWKTNEPAIHFLNVRNEFDIYVAVIVTNMDRMLFRNAAKLGEKRV